MFDYTYRSGYKWNQAPCQGLGSCGSECPHVSKKVSEAMATGTIGAGSKCYVSIKDIEPSPSGSSSGTWKVPALTPTSWRELSTCDATMVATPQSKGEEWTLLVKKDATDSSPVWQHASVDINAATFGGSKVALQFRGVKVRGHR